MSVDSWLYKRDGAHIWGIRGGCGDLLTSVLWPLHKLLHSFPGFWKILIVSHGLRTGGLPGAGEFLWANLPPGMGTHSGPALVVSEPLPPFLNWIIMNMQKHISFRYTTQWFNTFLHYEVITTVRPVTIHHHTCYNITDSIPCVVLDILWLISLIAGSLFL